jgi:hypothetical protein
MRLGAKHLRCKSHQTGALFSRLRNDWTSITLRSIGSSADPN